MGPIYSMHIADVWNGYVKEGNFMCRHLWNLDRKISDKAQQELPESGYLLPSSSILYIKKKYI